MSTETNINVLHRDLDQWKQVFTEHKKFATNNAQLASLLLDPEYLIQATDDTKRDLLRVLEIAYKSHQGESAVESDSSPELLEQLSSTIDEAYLDNMKSIYDNMIDDNTLPVEDFEKLITWE